MAEWLYVYGFVEPKTGKTLWYLIPRVNNEWLSLVYEAFAQDVEISDNKIILLVEDNAGWHRSQKVKIPSGIIVDFLPAYSPELQTAESAPPAPRFPRRKDGASRLWSLVDEHDCQ